MIRKKQVSQYYRKNTIRSNRLKWSGVILLCGALFSGIQCSANNSKNTPTFQTVENSAISNSNPVQQSQVQKNRVISVIGVGDIMLGTTFPKSDVPENNGEYLMKKVNAILTDADVTFGNLEGAVSDSGNTTKGGCTKCYAFRMPEKLADNLVTAGFDVMSVANNHVRDFGEIGLKNTQKVLDNLGIYYAGLVTKPSVVFEKGGIKYGFAAFAPNLGTVDIRDISNAQKIVKSLNKQSDIVIISFHGGAEGVANQHVPKKTEYFYGENRGDVHAFAHAVIDAGADVVFGHGPHVTRAVEVYKDRFIAYSLGNFCTYGPFSLVGESGIAPIIKVNMNERGEFLDGQITATQQIKRSHVAIDDSHQVIRIMRQLTETDFLDASITISNSGKITRK
jgi:poly-gamma-glutamate capsule biosynthesis protein CapA/YwtB (metallophosphatase superfamily)